MNHLNSIGFRSPPVLRRPVGLLAISFSVLTVIASDAVIDFRTFIPGVLDAPMYRADGTNRLSGPRYGAELLFGSSEGSVAPASTRVALPFSEGEWAGYLGRDEPVPRVLPGFKAGDRVWFQLRALEEYPGFRIPEDFPPPLFYGWSEIFSLIVSNTPTPLVGLKSFSLSVADLRIRRQGDQTVLRWDAGGGLVSYDLEMTDSLHIPGSWRSSGLKPALEIQGDRGWGSWRADWVLTNSIGQGAVFYRIKLLTPP